MSAHDYAMRLCCLCLVVAGKLLFWSQGEDEVRVAARGSCDGCLWPYPRPQLDVFRYGRCKREKGRETISLVEIGLSYTYDLDSLVIVDVYG